MKKNFVSYHILTEAKKAYNLKSIKTLKEKALLLLRFGEPSLKKERRKKKEFYPLQEPKADEQNTRISYRSKLTSYDR